MEAGEVTKKARHQNRGLRKVCACPRRRWSRCPHSWRLNFKPAGNEQRHYRISLDQYAGRRLTKSEARELAETLKTAIRNGTYPAMTPDGRGYEPPHPQTVGLPVPEATRALTFNPQSPEVGKHHLVEDNRLVPDSERMGRSTEFARTHIDPAAVYAPKRLAAILETGTQTIYRAVQRGQLKAATLNDRGDLRVLGQWVLDWLETLAGQPRTPPAAPDREERDQRADTPTYPPTTPRQNQSAPAIGLDVDDPLFPEDAAGAVIGQKKATLKAWRASGRGPEFLRLGRRVYYRKSALRAFMEGRTFRHSAEERAQRNAG